MEALIDMAGIFAGSFVIGFSGAMMPGPLLAVTITESAARGIRAGPLLVLGHMILEGALVAALALGLAAFLQNPWLIAAVSFVGAVVLCWMGQDMVRSAGRLSLASAGEARGRMHPVVAGMVVSLSNPYWTLWWITIGMAYVLAALRFGVAGLLAFFIGHILSDFVWYVFVGVSVARGRRIIPEPVYRWTIRLCGVTLIGFGLWFFWSGFNSLGSKM